MYTQNDYRYNPQTAQPNRLYYTGYSKNPMGAWRNYNGRVGGRGPLNFMPYQNSYGSNYRGGGLTFYGRNSNGYRSNQYGQHQKKNHSGCTVRKDAVSKTGKRFDIMVNGWKYTRRTGLWSFVAVPASSKYQKGNRHITMVAKIKSQFGVSTVWAYWNPSKQILSIPDMRINAGNGWVSYFTPKNRL